MIPRWLALILIGIVLLAAGAFLAPLLPAGVASFAAIVLYVLGGGAIVWGVIVLILSLTRGGPRTPAV